MMIICNKKVDTIAIKSVSITDSWEYTIYVTTNDNEAMEFENEEIAKEFMYEIDINTEYWSIRPSRKTK